MVNKNTVALLVLVAAPLFGTATAATITPDPPQYALGANENVLGGAILREAGTINSPGGRATATASGSPVPFVSASATSVPGDALVPGSSSGAESRLFYSYATNGPVDGVLVPLFVTTNLHAESSTPGSPNTRAAASLNIGGGTLSIDARLNTDFNSPLPGSDFQGTLTFNQFSGQLGQIALQAVATAVGGGSAMAFADPFIFIDPVFLARNPGYSVAVSPGTVNAVPAPAAVWLLGTGIVSLVLRRQRSDHQGTTRT